MSGKKGVAMMLKKIFVMWAVVLCGIMPLMARETRIDACETVFVRIPGEKVIADAAETLTDFCNAEECLARATIEDVRLGIDACECQICVLKESIKAEVLNQLGPVMVSLEMLSNDSETSEIEELLKSMRDLETKLIKIQDEAKGLDAAEVLEKPLEVILEYCSQYICLLEELIGE